MVASLQQYADYRNSIEFRKDGTWTVERIQNEIFATILSTAKITSGNTYIQCRIGLLPAFSSLRLDMTTSAAILTREDPQWPGIRTQAGSVFYDMYKEEAQTALDQARELTIDRNSFKLVEFATANISALLRQLGIEITPLSAERSEQIRAAITNPVHPYA